MEPFITLATAQVVRLVLQFIDLVSVRIENKRLIVSIEKEQTSSAAERIRKLDEAKDSLVEGLEAIEELKREAKVSQVEVEKALGQITALEENKASLEQELKHVKTLIKADVNTFRKVAGLSDADVQKERILGFVSGVLASIIASALISGTIWGFKTYIAPEQEEVEEKTTEQQGFLYSVEPNA